MKKIKVSELADINVSNVNSSDHFDDIIYLDTGNITENTIELLQKLIIGKDKIPSRAKRKVKNGTILYSTVRPRLNHYGYLINPPQNMIVSTGFITLDAKKDKIDPYYLYCCLTAQYITEYLGKIADTSVSAYPSIVPDDIGNLKLSIIDDLSEQKKIASVLLKLNNKILLNRKIISKLELMLKDIYNYWFIQFEFPNEEGKPYNSSGGDMIWNKKLNKYIPYGWSILKLSNRFEFERGIEVGADNYTSSNNESTIKYYRVSDIDEETNNYTNISLVGNKILDIFDVVVSFDGTVGKIGYGLCGAYSTGIRKIYDKKAELYSNVVYAIFSSEYIQKTIKKYATGSNILHAGESIENMYIPYNEKIYIKYSTETKKMFEKMINLKKQNQKLKSLCDFLLPNLMNGKIKLEL